MGVTVLPDVIDALVDTAVAATAQNGELDGVVVVDGMMVSSDLPQRLLQIGVEDPSKESAQSSGDAQQDWAHIGVTARDETGEVTCAAYCWVGDSGDAAQRAARAGVYDIVKAVDRLLRRDVTLGVPGVLWTSFGTATDLSQAQSTTGTDAQVIFKVAYTARI